MFDPSSEDVTVAELRAGKMVKDGRVMKPDTRKGLIRVVRADDGLTHFQWHERNAQGLPIQLEEDIILFPEEAKFVQVDRPGSRIFHLSFQDKDRDLFFWAQEVNAADDRQHAAKVNEAINTSAEDYMEAEPSDSAALPGAGGAFDSTDVTGPSGTLGVTSTDLARILSNISAGQAAQPSQQPTVAQPNAQTAAAMAASLLSQMAGGGAIRRQAPGPSLSQVLKAEVMVPLLQQADMVDKLGEFLPEPHRNPYALAEVAGSAQFRHQMEALGMALQTGQLDFSQFGLQPKGFSVQDFLSAIQEAVDQEQGAGKAAQQQPGSNADSTPKPQ